jgi:putative transposase
VMSQAVSPSTLKRYGIARVCRIWKISRSSVYASRHRGLGMASEPGKRGPKTKLPDEVMLTKIRAVLQEASALGFVGEGHRKVRARLIHRGIRAGKGRVLRLMRENGLLSPSRIGKPRGPRVHDGTIITSSPDEMWGTDGTRIWTRQEGLAWVFVAVDHHTDECVGIHAAQIGTRFEALEPIRQGVREHFGGIEARAVRGLKLRHDWGPQYISHDFQSEIDYLGFESSPSFAYAPEGNGIAERFIRTLKENLLWIRAFNTVEELRKELLAFRCRYNESWLIERHGHRTPSEVRASFTEAAA